MQAISISQSLFLKNKISSIMKYFVRVSGIVFIASTCICACTRIANTRTIIGKYVRNHEEIILSDDRFTYEFRYGWHMEKAEGNWSLDSNNHLLLNSKYKVDNMPLYVKKMQQSSESHKTIIKINYLNDIQNDLHSHIRCDVSVNGVLYNDVRNKMIYLDSVSTIRNIGVILSLDSALRPIPINKVYGKIKNLDYVQSSIDISIPLSIEMFYNKAFENDTFYIKGSRLYENKININPFVLKK